MTGSRRVEVRMDPDLFRWMENVRRLPQYGYSQRTMIELALNELRSRGVPRELPEGIENSTRFGGGS
jgi:hypothetical protein